jgi:copper(I)-binding protein
MTMRLVLPAVTAILLTVAAAISFARGEEAVSGTLVVTRAWARATPPGASVGAAYLTIENRGRNDERLVGITSPAAPSVVIHETVEEAGVARMRPLDAPVIPAGQTLAMQPGGIHIMLMGLSAPLKEGERLPLTLTFGSAGALTVEAEIAPIGSESPTEHATDHAM